MSGINRAKRVREGLELLRTGSYPKVDPRQLWRVCDPLPEERAVLTLAIALNQAGEKAAAIPWSCQEEAANFYNKFGLAATLDRIVEIGGPGMLE